MILKRFLFLTIATLPSGAEIVLSWLIFGNLIHKWTKNAFYEPAFLLFLSAAIPLVTRSVFLKRTKDWQEGMKLIFRTTIPIGLVIAMILACCYMGPITFIAFLYQGVRM